MGNPIKIPSYSDNDCLVCWPAGKTPKYLYVRFSGLVKCFEGYTDPPNRSFFPLDQHPEFPCVYQKIQDPWSISLTYNFGASSIYLIKTSDPPLTYFYAAVLEGCVKNFSNECACPSDGAEGGSAQVIDLNDEAAYTLAVTYGLAPTDGMLSDTLDLEGGRKNVKLCCRADKTNILVDYQPPE